MLSLNKIRIQWAIAAVGILALLPFFILSFYNHPSGDDFSVTNLVHQLGFWGAQKYWYENWKCSPVATSIGSLNPLVIRWFFGYKIMPVALLALYVLILYFFVNTMAGTALMPYQKWPIVLAILTSYLYSVPSVVEAFYWMCSTVSYALATILTVAFLNVLFKFKNEKENRMKYLFLSAILLVLLTQGAESFTIFMAAFIPLIILVEAVFYKRLDKLSVVLLFVAGACAFFVLNSPGIYVRAQAFPQPILPGVNGLFSHFTLALGASLTGVASLLFKKSLLILLFSVILLSDIDLLFREKKRPDNYALPVLHPIVALLIMIALPMIVLFPACWISGVMPAAGRVPNTAYFYLLLGWMFLLLCTASFLKRKYQINFQSVLYKRIQWASLGMICIALLLPNNVRAAYGDLFAGRARAFDEELNQRYETIEKCREDTCLVPPVTIHPASLWRIEDITTNAKDVDNLAYSIFFGKKAIRLSEESADNQPKDRR